MKPKPVVLSQDAARRTARAVLAYEHSGGTGAAGWHAYRGDDGGDPVRIGLTTVDWAKDTTADITLIYEKDADTENPGPDKLEGVYNRCYDVGENTLVIVAKAKNGKWYLVDSAGRDDGSDTCKSVAIGGQDLTTVNGYDSTKTQLLGHEAGCLKWFDTTDCGSTTGGGP